MANAGQGKSRETPKAAAATLPRVAQNFPKSRTKKDQAAILIAEDELIDEVIAATVGVTRRTLTNWKQNPEFAALVGGYHGQIVAQSLKLPIAKKHERVRQLDDLLTRSLTVIASRAERYGADVDASDSARNATRRFFGTDTPTEAATGLLVSKETVNNTGQKTVNWEVDTGLMKEIRDLHKQAAQELGQWEDKASLDIQQTVTTIQVIGEE